MRKSLAMLLSVALALCLCGCSGDSDKTEPTGDETSEVKTTGPQMPELKTPGLPMPEIRIPGTSKTPEPSPVPRVSPPEIPSGPDAGTPPDMSKGSDRSGDAKTVAFAVAWCTSADPAAAAEAAAKEALDQLGCPAKGLVFYEYYPKTIKTTVKNDKGETKETEKQVPDPAKDKRILPAIRGAAGSVPVIGCRARSLVTGGTMLENTVAVLAIGGEAVSCKVAKARLAKDRQDVGSVIAEALKDVNDLKIVLALSEMNLSFDTTPGISVEDFIRGILDTTGKGVTLFGGNCMPNDYPDDKGGVQFLDDEMLTGHVVAMGIGGPLAVHANHTNEFIASQETVAVTEADDKWVYKFDDKPAAEAYRQIRGMTPDEAFTSDGKHPIGVVVAPGKVYLRMILDWIDAEGKDREGNASTHPPGSLQFVAAVPVGTKVKILRGGDDPQAILDSAKEGIVQSIAQAGAAKPLLALLSDCCARGGRLREFRKADECEIRQAILPALGPQNRLPIFGFYAWGELGPIAGEFGGLPCMYQQHTFVSAVITEK